MTDQLHKDPLDRLCISEGRPWREVFEKWNAEDSQSGPRRYPYALPTYPPADWRPHDWESYVVHCCGYKS